MIIKVCDQGYVGYYHWFLLMLANLQFMPNNITPTAIYIPFLDNDETTYQIESLKILLPGVELINAAKNSEPPGIVWTAPLCPLPPNRGAPVEAFRYFYIRDKFLQFAAPPIPEYKRIYISRRRNAESLGHNGVLCRHIINEYEMMQALKPFGFVEVLMEGRPFAEQISIFNNANIIISHHGGGLANCCFASKTTHIIETLTPDCWWTHFEDMCNKLEVPYTRFTNMEIVSHSHDPGHNGNNGIIDIQSIVSVISEICKKYD